MREEEKKYFEKIERIAIKYAQMVEDRIDSARSGLTGDNLREIYDGIQMLGNITATLERSRHIENME